MIAGLASSLLALVVVVLCAGSFYFYHVAVARASKEFLSESPDLKTSPEVEESKETTLADDEWWNSQNFERRDMDSEDGIHLKAYYLPATGPSDKTVIIAHGYSGNATQMSSYARMYHEKWGYNVLLPDARGHGESGGGYIGFGWPERKDYLKWIGRVLDENGADSQIVLHGVSMGGATVMMTSGEDLPPKKSFISFRKPGTARHTGWIPKRTKKRSPDSSAGSFNQIMDDNLTPKRLQHSNFEKDAILVPIRNIYSKTDHPFVVAEGWPIHSLCMEHNSALPGHTKETAGMLTKI